MTNTVTDRIQKASFEFPIQISSDGRYLVDQNNKPFLYHADTGWLIFSGLTLEEAAEYLDNRLEKKFNTIQAMLLPMWSNLVNQSGVGPFIDGDLSRPREEYFKHADSVFALIEEKGLALCVGPAFISCWDDYEFRWSAVLKKNGPDKCREYGRFLGNRYHRFQNVMWFIGGDRQPLELKEELHQLALGIKETAPHQLITYHSTTTHSSTDEYPEESWLDFSMTYTYFKGKKNAAVEPGQFPEVYEVNHKEYNKRFKPFVLGEAMYEGPGGDVDNGSPYRSRKQAYWSVLSGSCGHAYGSHIYDFKPGWRNSLNFTGTTHMRYLYELLAKRDWHQLVPDFEHHVLIEGYSTYSRSNYVTAAYTESGSLLIAYIPFAPSVLLIDTKRLKPGMKALWVDPTSGCEFEAVGQKTADEGILQFDTPYDQNMAGDPDWILVLEEK